MRDSGRKVLDIGFGNGESLLWQAEAYPDWDILGVDVHLPGVGHALMEIDKRALTNIRIIAEDVMQVLPHFESSLDLVQLFFPDPWPKRRHHKRRLILQPPFLQALQNSVKPGGILHMATDWAPYAEAVLIKLNELPEWENQSPTGTFCARPAHRPTTRFEQRGIRLGHSIFDLIFRKVSRVYTI